MKFTLYTADCVGSLPNSIYPHKCVITDEDSMKAAVAFDHVAAEYTNNHRSNTDFLSSDNIPMDCDNDHSDDPSDWVTPLEVAMAFPKVEFVVVYSRNNMLPKSGKSPRPRFHVYFPTQPITDSAEYTALKKRIAAEFPYFDKNALDSARLLFGVQNPQVEIYNGDISIIDFLDNADFEQWDSNSASVPEGSRNSTMSHYAGRIIKRLGNTDEAYKQYLKQAEKCDPPLDDSELQTIWNSAVKFGRKVSNRTDISLPISMIRALISNPKITPILDRLKPSPESTAANLYSRTQRIICVMMGSAGQSQNSLLSEPARTSSTNSLMKPKPLWKRHSRLL